jgi:phospholipid/cholesterol/gamma-HCH transport system substrate-binding protein
MSQRAQQVRLGIFLLGFIVLLVGGLVFLAGSQFWERRDSYIINFSYSVAGLEIGAPVKLNGVRVGRVDEISLDPEHLETVVVEVSLEGGIPLRRDANAVVKLAGITGLKFIELDPGTSTEPLIDPNTEDSIIPAGESDIDVWTGRAEDIYQQIQIVVSRIQRLTEGENMEHIEGIIEETHRAMAEAVVTLRNLNEVIAENRDPLKRTVASVGRASDSVGLAADELTVTARDARADIKGALNAGRRAAERIEQLAGTGNKTLRSATGVVDDVRDTLTRERLAEVMDALIAALQAFTRVAASLQATVDQSQVNIQATLEAIRTASEQLEEFARTIRDNPGALIRGGGLPEEEVPR